MKAIKIYLLYTTLISIFFFLSGNGFTGDYKLPDTGIEKCYDNDSEMTCPSLGEPFYGQDAQYVGHQLSYRDNGDDTITDLNTGLMWQKWDDQNDAGGRTWESAIDYCRDATTGGYTTWRLPSRRDLVSLVYYDYQAGYASISRTYFPDCLYSLYWTNTTFPYPTYYDEYADAYSVSFYGGYVGPKKKDEAHYVRCVRGEPIPQPSFYDNGDGIISDAATHLMWQQTDDQNAAGGRTWENALDYCETLTWPSGGHSDWRLPSIRELAVCRS